MLTRFEPFADFDRLSSELFGPPSRRAGTMPLDAYRRGDRWVVNVDLPGVDPESIDLTVDRKALLIQAQRSWQPAQGDLVLAAERPRGGFSRKLVLSEEIDTGAIQADYHDGVLTVVLPVAESSKPRKVVVTNGANEGQATVGGEPTSAQPTEAQPAQTTEAPTTEAQATDAVNIEAQAA
jgi:HSP20 family protein